MNTNQFIIVTDEIAFYIRKKGAAEIALKKAKRELEQHELFLLSQNPLQGKNKESREIEKELLLQGDRKYLEIASRIFDHEVEVAQCEVEIAAYEKNYSGMRWEARTQIIARLRWGDGSITGNVASEHFLDTEAPLEGALDTQVDASLTRNKQIPANGAELVQRFEEALDRQFGDIPVPAPVFNPTYGRNGSVHQPNPPASPPTDDDIWKEDIPF